MSCNRNPGNHSLGLLDGPNQKAKTPITTQILPIQSILSAAPRAFSSLCCRAGRKRSLAVQQKPDNPPEKNGEDANRNANTADRNQLCQQVTGFFPARVVPAELERQQIRHHFVGGFIPLRRVRPAGFDDDFVELDQIPAFPVVLQVSPAIPGRRSGLCRC